MRGNCESFSRYVDGYGDPYLGLHGILGDPIELPDSEVLFDRLEKRSTCQQLLYRSQIVNAGRVVCLATQLMFKFSC
jgi:hypothetical protein